MNVLSEVGKSECCGCTACVNICPTKYLLMNENNDGFLYPSTNTNSKCIMCGKCYAACPILVRKFSNCDEYNSDFPIAFGGYHTNDLIRKSSSSGGLFSAFSEQIFFEQGYVYGVSLDIENLAKHCEISSLHDLPKLRGSKYVQSDINYTYAKAKDRLDSGEKVLFTGTPCQLAGLSSFLSKDYPNLIRVDVACHGVPSPKVLKIYFKYLETRYNSTIKNYLFRSKENGWIQNGFQMGTEVQFHSNKIIKYQPAFNDKYMVGFLSDLYLRPSCYNCLFKDRKKTYCDITIADFWGVKNNYPELYDKKGTSLIIIHNKKGESFFKECSFLNTKKINIEHGYKYNPLLLSSVKYNPLQQKFFSDLKNMPFRDLAKKYLTFYQWFFNQIKRRIF